MKTFTTVAVLVQLSNQISAQQLDSPDKKMNVLLIYADDLNASLNCYGNEGVITPNLDGLARKGRMFERAYCQAALSNPSRTSTLTGWRPHELGIWTNLPHFRERYPSLKTLPEYFKEHGYYTVGIGKVYHNRDHIIHGDPQSWSEPQTYNWAAHYQDWYIEGRPSELHSDILVKGQAVQCEDVPDESYLDGRISNAAVEKLRELHDTTFFLAVGFWKPHLPFNAPKKYWDLYDRDKLPPFYYKEPVPGVPEIAYTNSDEARGYSDVNKVGPISEIKQKELRHGYFAAISYLDKQVGKVLDELDRLGLSKNTIIIFLGDNGYHASEHGQFGKSTNFEIGTRVPLIIATPDIPKPGSPSNSIVELVDIYPTLINLCQLPHPNEPEQLSGLSLLPILNDPNACIKTTAISQITRSWDSTIDNQVIGSTIRTKDYRYTIWHQIKDAKVIAEELYDLSNDILSVENLIDYPAMKDVKDNLRQMLLEQLGD